MEEIKDAEQNNWAFPHEKSEKKGQCQKVNFVKKKNISYYIAFGHLNPFFNQFVVFG